MVKPKLSTEEAQRRKRESDRKSKQRPEAKLKERERKRRLRALKCAELQNSQSKTDKTHIPVKQLELKRQYRSDPAKLERELELQRQRRARKRIQKIADSSHINLHLDSELQQSKTDDTHIPVKQLELKRQYRLDPTKLERKMELQRQRRARKRVQNIPDSSNKRLRLEEDSKPSTSYAIPISIEESLWNKTVSQYLKNISDGPVHRCICCDRLWFKKSMSRQSTVTLENKNIDKAVIEYVFPANVDEGIFCSSCMSNIREGKIPPLAVSYGFKYPQQPSCLTVLNDLEERLVSLRIPFMQIKECSYDRQLAIKGTVVNVPIHLNQTVSMLPKNINDTQTVHVKLKRRLKFKSNYMYRLINPKRVFEAACYLVKTPLYQSQHVPLDMDWYQKFSEESFEPASNYVVDMNESENDEEMDIADIDWESNAFEDDEDYPNPAPVETVIQKDISTEMGLAIAPGENKLPISLIFDDLGEELSYPKIYCGELRQFTRAKPPTYTEIIKSELRRYDRRGATPQKILYSHQKLLHQKFLSCISIQLRHKVIDVDHVTAANLSNPEYVKNLQYKDLAFKFMKSIKASPAHWSQEKTRVCAQIRQFGFPTIFLTLSAAENRWFDLIKHLVYINEHRILTQSEFDAMKSVEKNKLISNDPVTCALYFEHKVKSLWKTFSCSEGPFGKYKITHYYQRTEFQQRGSPHFHVLLWLKDAPQFDGTNAQEVEKFIDSIIMCSKNHPLAPLQTHKHTHTCQKKSRFQDNEYCRFNIPFFPMDKTRILLPLALDDERRDPIKFKIIREFLAQLEANEVLMTGATFKEFLDRLTMSYDEYFIAIRSGINRPTVFLKRSVDEVLINAYNPKILGLIQSNIDVQYILDQHAVVAYLVDYVNKPGRGLSQTVRDCIHENSQSKQTLKECLKNVANQFINAIEISAQEAAWSILELPMSKMSEDTIFIPTFRPEERTRMVKSQEALKALDPSSRDVYELNVLDRYARRPVTLEQETLANFASWYEVAKIGSNEMKLLSGNQYLKRRTKPKIIQYRKYKESQDENEYYREQVMLFTHWRDEKTDILSRDFKTLYTDNIETIRINRKNFVADENLDIEEELIQLEQSRSAEEEANDESALVSFENVLEYDEKELLAGDISLDMKASHGREFSIFQPTNKYPDDKYRKLIRICNLNQRDILYHMKYCLRREPNNRIHWIIQGAAGTGKSFLINIIEQTLIRMFEKADQDPSQPTVLKLAPTGKAASNIKGETLHHALGIALSNNSHLGCSSIAEYAVKYANVKCVIIDEISMVGANMYEKVNNRLQQFKGNEEPFGGLHILHFGDFNQLPPVKDIPIYKQKSGLSQLSQNPWHLVQYYELGEIMRQKEDKTYAELLNRLAAGKIKDKDLELLKSKETTLENVPRTATLLFHSNSDVDAANKIRLNSIEGLLVQSKANDSVSGTAPKNNKRKTLQKIWNWDRTKTGNLESVVNFKVGAKYMLTYNVDTADGLVNGAVGTLQNIEYCTVKRSDQLGVKRVWLDFVNQKEIGKELRRQSARYSIINKIDLKWTPINRLRKVIHNSKNDAISVMRDQFPLILAEAMTIHKSQGATFQEAAVGFKRNLTRPLQYVALSRVTSIQGLYILGDYTAPQPPRDDDPILQEMKRLKSNTIVPIYAFLHQHNDPNTLQIMYHNVQSLNAHYDDIAADPCTMNSDILLFAETWTIMKDTFKLDGFDHHHLLSDVSRRKPSGVSIYIKKSLNHLVEEVEIFPNYDTGVHVMVANFKTKFRVAVLYAKPGSSDDDIFNAIEDSLDGRNEDYKTVLAGDFNMDMSTPSGKEFCDMMDNIYFLTLRNNTSHYTTVGQTTIDAIFSTHGVRTCGVYESAFSHHLPLYVQVPWEKTKVRTCIPPEDDDPRLECGPDLLDNTGNIEWAEDDGFPLI